MRKIEKSRVHHDSIQSGWARSRPNAAQQNPCLFDHLVGEGEQLVWDLETTMLTHARLLSYASDSDDVEFRVFLANLECSLKIGRIAPTL